MIFYHGTTDENWKRIQEEGVLFGVREFAKSRATYLTNDIDEAKQYGEILLQVEYDPLDHSEMNNYTEDCWQCRVYEPIPIDVVKKL